MQNIPDAARAALKASVQKVITRAQVIRAGQPVTPNLTAVGGSLTYDGLASIRTSGSISLIDPTGELDPGGVRDLISPFTVDLAIYRGLVLPDGSEALAQLGLMRLTKLKLSERGGAVTFSANLFDRGARAQKPMPRPWVIGAGTTVEAAIPPLLLPQIPSSLFHLTSTQFQLASLTLAAKSKPWDEAVKLATSAGCALWPDRQGVINLAQISTAASSAFVWEFIEGVNADFMDTDLTIDSVDVPNVVVVVGTNPAAPGIRAEAWDNDPTSPTWRYGDYGENVDYVEEPRIATQAQAQAMANARLVEDLGPGQSVEFDAVPNPWLDVGDTIAVTRAVLGLDGARMVVTRIDMPWAVTDLMHVTARRSILTADDPISSVPIIAINAPPPPPPVTQILPDLIIQSISMNPTSPGTGDTVRFSAVVANQGTADVPPGTIIGVSFTVDGTVVSWDHTFVAGLPAGNNVTITATSGPSNSSTWTATPQGNHVVIATADDLAIIVELNETNNSLTLPFTVSAAVARPDLVIQSLSWTPASPVVGDLIVFSAVVQNIGTGNYDGGTMAPLRVSFYVNGVEVSFSASFVGVIAPGGTHTITAEHNFGSIALVQRSAGGTAAA